MSVPEARAGRPRQQRVLLIAYHFPPIQGSTGTTRTIAFSRYLQQYGWDACVLTINPNAYEAIDAANQSLIAKHVAVKRAWGVDAKRTFSVRGKYPQALALPDRWQSWILGGYWAGFKIVKQWKPDAIMSTYPIASAHVIGYLLKRTFKLPWIAEFRDPMLQAGYPKGARERKSFGKIERAAIVHANSVIVTTEGCRNFYLRAYPDLLKSKMFVITNGYDPEPFSRPRPGLAQDSKRIVLLHSGLLYPHERNPTAFFEAVSSLKRKRFFDGLDVEFRFRGSGTEEKYASMTKELGIEDLTRFLPIVPYESALEEMLNVHALMLFQAKSCNDQIPAKAYEYLRCQKPIVAFTDSNGDTAALLTTVGVTTIASLERNADIEALLEMFLTDLRHGESFVVTDRDSRRFSRELLTGELAAVLTKASS